MADATTPSISPAAASATASTAGPTKPTSGPGNETVPENILLARFGLPGTECVMKSECLVPRHLLETYAEARGEPAVASDTSGQNKGRRGAALGYVPDADEGSSAHGDTAAGTKRSRPAIASGLQDELNDLPPVARKLLRARAYPFKTERSAQPARGKRQNKPRKSSLPPTEESVLLAELEKVTNFGSRLGAVADAEKPKVDWAGKVYVGPLTTVGNLPYRRVMKHYGADITCSEMALAAELVNGSPSEWALLRRHPSEDVFGIQVAGAFPDRMGRAAELVANHCTADFVDVNMGCPIDLVCNQGMGCSLMERSTKLKGIIASMSRILPCPLTLKMRIGVSKTKPIAQDVITKAKLWGGVSAVLLHGRTRAQRYTKRANWAYISETGQLASAGKWDPMACQSIPGIPLIGNGDIMSFTEWEAALSQPGVSTAMLARGALIKPWLPTEIKERRHWDISSRERMDMLRLYTKFGLEHWGADATGVSRTRRFLLEFMSFLHRYVPVGLLEVLPQNINDRPPMYYARDDLEALMGSPDVADWITLTEMLLGKVPEGFKFTPKHKANSYEGDADARVTLTALTGLSVNSHPDGVAAAARAAAGAGLSAVHAIPVIREAVCEELGLPLVE